MSTCWFSSSLMREKNQLSLCHFRLSTVANVVSDKRKNLNKKRSRQHSSSEDQFVSRRERKKWRCKNKFFGLLLLLLPGCISFISSSSSSNQIKSEASRANDRSLSKPSTQKIRLDARRSSSIVEGSSRAAAGSRVRTFRIRSLAIRPQLDGGEQMRNA